MRQNGTEAAMDCRLRASWREMIYTQIIHFFPFREYSIFHCTSQIHLDCREKLGLKEVTWTKSHFYNWGPFIFPPKHTEALHLSPVPPPSWILLYVNSMYLRRLKGNTASAGDSEMLHFSLLTKGKGPGWLHKSWTNRIDAFAALRVPYSNH